MHGDVRVYPDGIMHALRLPIYKPLRSRDLLELNVVLGAMRFISRGVSFARIAREGREWVVGRVAWCWSSRIDLGESG